MQAWGAIIQGWALAAQGKGEEGMAEMRLGVAAIRATGAELRQPYYLTLLAEACGHTGQAEAGLKMVVEGLAGAHRHGECWQEAELHRLQGELLLLTSPRDPHASVTHSVPPMCDAEVEQCFHRALAIARHQQAKSLELRAAVSLARLRQYQGKRTEAYGLLAPAYDWFSEGFDTADLQDAKALLDELG